VLWVGTISALEATVATLVIPYVFPAVGFVNNGLFHVLLYPGTAPILVPDAVDTDFGYGFVKLCLCIIA
jgi:hypothetical protein